MAYSIDLRSRVIDFINQGNSREKASVIFKVGTSTITRWLGLLSETGSLEKRPLNRIAPKFESEKLNAYIEENPDALLKDVADHFGGSISGAFHALEREKITYKKKSLFIKREMKKNARNLRKN
jgi:transposase